MGTRTTKEKTPRSVIAVLLILALFAIAVWPSIQHHPDPPGERIANPQVILAAAEQSGFLPSWPAGYTFAPHTAELMDDGTILLLYRGDIRNDTVSRTLHGVAGGSWVADEDGWRVTTADGRELPIPAPRISLRAKALDRFRPASTGVHPSSPAGTNLQPDGRLILTARARLDEPTVAIRLPGCYLFASIHIRDGHFVARQGERECHY